MTLIDIMLKRRSTRKFNDEPVTKEELERIESHVIFWWSKEKRL